MSKSLTAGDVVRLATATRLALSEPDVDRVLFALEQLQQYRAKLGIPEPLDESGLERGSND